jgi:hypothetical protein
VVWRESTFGQEVVHLAIVVHDRAFLARGFVIIHDI